MSGYYVLAIESGKVTRAEVPTLPEAQRTMRKKAPSSAIFVGKKCFAKSVGISAAAFDELILAARAGGLGTCSFCDGDAVVADTDGDAFCRKHEMLRDGTDGNSGAEEGTDDSGDDEGDVGETDETSVADSEGEVSVEEPGLPRSATPQTSESPRQAPRRVRPASPPAASPPAAPPPECVIPGCTNTPSPCTSRLDATLRVLCLMHRRRAFTVRNESKTDAAGAVKILRERAVREQSTPGGTGCAWPGCAAPRSSKDTDDPTLVNYCGRHRGLAKSHKRRPGQGNASRATPPPKRPTPPPRAVAPQAPQASPVAPSAPRAVFEQLLADHELVEFVGRDVVEALAARVKRGAR